MPIISKESFNKLTQGEKEKIRKTYQRLLRKEYSDIYTDEEMNGALGLANAIFPKEQLQPQPLTYSAIIKELFKDGAWQVAGREYPREFIFNDDANDHYFLNCTSEKQGNKLLAINRLLNVAKFLNGEDWKPDWEKREERKWYLSLNGNKINISYVIGENSSIVYFRTEELSKQAVTILGEETVRLALSFDW